MKRKTIEFRELLERLLPLDELPAAERLRVRRALEGGTATQIEQASLLALRQLEQSGALVRLPHERGAPAGAVRYQSKARLDVITIELPSATEREGLTFHPRLALVSQANTSLDQVRRLMRLDDTLGAGEARLGSARVGLVELLDHTGRDLLGASAVRFVPRESDEDSSLPRPLDPDLAAAVLARAQLVVYCPDVTAAPRLEPAASRHAIRSVAAVAVCPEDAEPCGHLEAWSPDADAFGTRELALLSLLADCAAIAWERSARIEKLVFVDPLTGAFNRPYFDRQVINEMARAHREGASFAMCIADIDNFKHFNTSYGYEAGNQVLVHVAETLKAGVRPFDTVARWGGEEFAILLTSPVQGEDVVTVCERLRTLVERQIATVESLDRTVHRVGVTVSMGVALFPDDAKTAPDLWRAANQALLRAKMPPKNRVAYFGNIDGTRKEAG